MKILDHVRLDTMKKTRLISWILFITALAAASVMIIRIIPSVKANQEIKKIWETTDFPDLKFYLLYGLISNAIIWVIYQLFSFLIDFEGQIRELIAAKNNMQKKAKSDEDSISESNENMFYKK